MYEAIEHWKQYKQEKQLNKTNEVKFNHLEIFKVTLGYTYIITQLALFTFVALTIIEKY